MNNNRALGVAVPEILIPDEKVNMKKWSVVACDQFTTNQKYWLDVEKQVGVSPSTLHIMLPEIYLERPDVEERIARTKEIMRSYLDDSVLNLLPAGFVLVERYIDGQPRKGLMVAVDLEEYDFDIYKKPLIRATEETLLERIPPRVEIRKNADVEMPHVLVLMDDRENKVIEPLWQRRNRFPKLYDFDLMQDGGRIAGYFVNDEAAIEATMEALKALPVHDGMRFCVGDGNHSLATAKAVWNQAKEQLSEEELAESPMRYALVELINLYDDALTLKPIHRVLYNVNSAQCVQKIVDQLNKTGREARLVFSRRKPAMQMSHGVQTVFFTSKDSSGRIEINNPSHPLVVGEIQDVLEKVAREMPSSKLEYIHGDAELEAAASEYDTLGFYMPAMDKDTFFDMIIHCGVLPKKSFSLGEANEKRYYLECRLLTQAAEVVEDEAEEAEGAEEPEMLEELEVPQLTEEEE
ncbi:MAG: DUF1015 domain-containing protein [Christensenellaceae bacterium]|nr:DUF1015 domain-containing protein [Christensenellaceae bacterium]